MRRDIVSSKQLQNKGLSRTAIARAVESGELRRLGAGMYSNSEFDPMYEHIIARAKKYPSGIISNVTALSFHHLTEVIDDKVHVDVDKAKFNSRENKAIVPHRVTAKKLVGYKEYVLSGHQIKIYSPERCLFEAYFMGKNDPLFAVVLKNYVAKFRIDHEEIMRLGKEFNVDMFFFIKLLTVESST